MLVKQQLLLLLLLFALLNEINLQQNLPTRTSTIKTLPLRISNKNRNSSFKQVRKTKTTNNNNNNNIYELFIDW